MFNRIIVEIWGYFRQKKFRNDKRVIIFLICLLISTIMWFLNALGKYYETTLNYPVNYGNLPEGLYLANNPPKTFELIVEAHGFTLLKNKFNLSFTPVLLDVQRMISGAEKLEGRSYKIVTSGLINRISDQISSEIKILEIRPESFNLDLDGLDSKKVKVVANLELDFEPQYNLSSEVQITPEFVEIIGPVAIIDSISEISTSPRKISKINKNAELMLSLENNDKLKISPAQVKVVVPVEEFTEKVITVPVAISGKPENTVIKLFPSEVQVSFRVGLSKYSGITADNFLVNIPYSEMKPGALNVPVQVDKRPRFVFDVACSPQTIEFLIEKE